MPLLTIVIPVGKGDTPEPTLRSLAKSEFRDFTLVVSQDEVGNANWARNRGFEKVTTPFVLFSDADINWRPTGIGAMVNALRNSPEASYAYGAYEMGPRTIGAVPFTAAGLRRMNYISTMAVIRTEHFPGFDESIRRLQDWDLWLTMLERGHVGVYVGQTVFSTTVRQGGITYGGSLDWKTAERIVKEKHSHSICASPSTP